MKDTHPSKQYGFYSDPNALFSKELLDQMQDKAMDRIIRNVAPSFWEAGTVLGCKVKKKYPYVWERREKKEWGPVQCPIGLFVAMTRVPTSEELSKPGPEFRDLDGEIANPHSPMKLGVLAQLDKKYPLKNRWGERRAVFGNPQDGTRRHFQTQYLGRFVDNRPRYKAGDIVRMRTGPWLIESTIEDRPAGRPPEFFYTYKVLGGSAHPAAQKMRADRLEKKADDWEREHKELSAKLENNTSGKGPEKLSE